MSAETLLIEIGTEELPPTSLRTLGEALHREVIARLDEARIAHGASRWFASPRRLAVSIESVAATQPDAVAEKLGPAVAAAFGADGNPTGAALGFARGCGVEVDALLRVPGERGERLAFRQHVPGQPTVTLLPALTEAALAALPVAKRMRWGARRAEFVRPVHWVVMLFGSTVVPGEVLGVATGRETRGHRVHGAARIALDTAADYERALREQGSVVADYETRRADVAAQVRAKAAELGGTAVIDEALLDEVCSLVEWPRALAGRFEERFLEVPAEALISSMKQHQKYFHVVDANGALQPHFITVANVDSNDAQKVVDGNERVIRPRLSDAAFFFAQDKQSTLAARRERLRSIVFQTELGSIWDKTERVATLARTIGTELGADPALCARAAELSKSDLVSEMVLEFDELQGIMGTYYARNDGEDPAVAAALTEQYLPRQAGDALPQGTLGIALALAAVVVATRSRRPEHTFGLYRLEVLSALVNAVLLLVVAAWALYEAIGRIQDPPEVPGLPVLVVGAIGLVTNFISLRLLSGGESLAAEGARLDVLADTVGSVAVVAGGAVIMATGWTVIDAWLGLAISLWIVPRSVRLAGSALRVLVEAAPPDVDLDAVDADLRAIPDVVDVHDLHVWTLTSDMELLTAHVMVTSGADHHAVLDQARSLLGDRHGIYHATLQVEPEDHAGCDELDW